MLRPYPVTESSVHRTIWKRSVQPRAAIAGRRQHGRVEDAMSSFVINGRQVGRGQRPFIIAEVGSNHNGDMDLCYELIDEAARCGADAVKFQSWSSTSLVSKAEYERNT